MLSLINFIQQNSHQLSSVSKNEQKNEITRRLYRSLTARFGVICTFFKKRKKHPWRSVTLKLPAALLKVTHLHGCFSRS